jgi:hypothetical protein
MTSLVSPVNQLLTRLVKDVLARAAGVAAGGGGGGGGAAVATAPAVAAGAGAGIDVTVPAVAAGAGAGAGIDVTLPAVAAGAGGGDPELVNPVSEEQPAKAVSAIMPAIIVRKLRHSVPSLASRCCPEPPRPRISQSL